jgi:hypothetical protein
MSVTPRATLTLGGAICISMFVIDADAAKQYVNVESTNSYTPCFGGSDLLNSNSSASNFLNAMTSVQFIFLAANGGVLQDPNAWNVDYMDPGSPEAPPGADDNLYSDAVDVAVSFYQGHGISVIQGNLNCTDQSYCNPPPPGAANQFGGPPLSNNGTCSRTPLANRCNWASMRALVTCGTGDQGNTIATPDPRAVPNHLAVMSSGAMVLGNNPIAGNWRGAGTNGGASMVIYKISHGLDTFYPNLELSPAFAGLEIFASVQTAINGDSEDSQGFGAAVAATFTANPFTSAGLDYANAISNVMDGSGCKSVQFPNGNQYGGFNGCGCHTAVSYSTNFTNAAQLVDTTWVSLEVNNPVANSVTQGAYYAGCNYSLTTYPWSGGN